MNEREVVKARANRRYQASAEAVRAVIVDQPGHAMWFPGMRRVEALPAEADGVPIWRHEFTATKLRIEVIDRGDESHAPIEWRVSDERGYFEATWRFEFMRESGDACTVVMEETRRVHGLVARLWAWAFVTPEHFVNKYLDALEHAVPSRRGVAVA
ncbi:MAG: SRPBCC family protein [Phycisphaerales bacterium]